MLDAEDYASSTEYDYSGDRDSIDGFENDDVVPECGTSSARSSMQVITKESLLAAQRDDLCRVMDLLQLSERHARTLLIYHRWDVDKVLAVLVEKGGDFLFAKAGVPASESRDLHWSISSSPEMCNICFEDVAPINITRMDCGHCYCNDCWTEHFIVKINDGQSRQIRCMAPKCYAICDEAIVRKLVSAKDPYMADRFERFLLESYIEDNNKVNWCPSVPHCGNAIRIDGDICCEVECSCGLQFCFNCLLEAHSPCSCQMWQLWEKKCRDESETVNWITANTKPCPKCFKHIEKNGGCNLVSCICGQAFCWLCGGATGHQHSWSSISGHSCGRYKEQGAERAKCELHRYIHYHKFYKAHTDSYKEESKLKELIQGKISILESRESSMKDYGWVMNGLCRLFRSRRILSYSYPFAFYMFSEDLFKDEMAKEEREIKQNLFEDQQQQLECNVERLSKSLIEPLDEFCEEAILATRMNIINLSVLVDQLCHNMYECIENDLLGALQHTAHNIAPYKSKGIERASELRVWCDSDPSPRDMKPISADSCGCATGNGIGASEPGRSSFAWPLSNGSSILDENGGSEQRRTRKDVSVGIFDLNMPPDVAGKRLKMSTELGSLS